jgi:thiol-disulfide isomerase/thioredoxin
MPLEFTSMTSRAYLLCAVSSLLLSAIPCPAWAQFVAQTQESSRALAQTPKPGAPQAAQPAKQPSPEEELQLALSDAGSDRASLVRNLESFLSKYPDYPNRTRIYRAIVEASIQLQDNTRAADYAERMVALNPNDISILLLAIELLERREDEAAFRRAISYSTRVLELVERTSPAERSPRVSIAQWELEKKNDLANTYFLRGDLYLKVKDFASARKDLQISYDTFPSAGAAQRLGETAELQNDLNFAIQEYARAFALAEGKNGNVSRQEIRRKIGNAWRLAHGSEDGLGEYLLRTYDEVARASGAPKSRRNEGVREVSDFTLRRAPDGTPYSMKDARGKVLVVNFWATWCGPCHALEPIFARVATEFQGLPAITFLSANCDEDETLVAPYLQKAKLRTEVVFADGLDRLFSVYSFPTVIVIGREGKIAYRSDGFDPDTFERNLTAAVRRALAEANAPPASGHH